MGTAERRKPTTMYWKCKSKGWNEAGDGLNEFSIGFRSHAEEIQRIWFMFEEEPTGWQGTLGPLLWDLDWKGRVPRILGDTHNELEHRHPSGRRLH